MSVTKNKIDVDEVIILGKRSPAIFPPHAFSKRMKPDEIEFESTDDASEGDTDFRSLMKKDE